MLLTLTLRRVVKPRLGNPAQQPTCYTTPRAHGHSHPCSPTPSFQPIPDMIRHGNTSPAPRLQLQDKAPSPKHPHLGARPSLVGSVCHSESGVHFGQKWAKNGGFWVQYCGFWPYPPVLCSRLLQLSTLLEECLSPDHCLQAHQSKKHQFLSKKKSFPISDTSTGGPPRSNVSSCLLTTNVDSQFSKRVDQIEPVCQAGPTLPLFVAHKAMATSLRTYATHMEEASATPRRANHDTGGP